MPSLTVSWDLAIVVFFAIVMSYSFIIGKEQAVKIIIATYIAIIASQGVGNIIGRLMGGSSAFLSSIGLPDDTTILPVAKIFLFALFIIVFVQKSGIEFSFDNDTGKIMSLVFTALFGFSTAGLIVSSILTFIAGSAILDNGFLTNTPLLPLFEHSTLLQVMILNQDLWYMLPALLIIVVGFLQSADEE